MLAGAGSGKTAVITEKIAWLIRAQAYAPDSLIAVTFTNKAAREMKSRVADALNGSRATGLWISTFHALGLRILNAHLAEAGYRRGLSIYSADDSEALVARLLRAEAPGQDRLAAKVHWRISQWKHARSVAPVPQDELDALAAGVCESYEAHLRAHNAVDFDDLIVKPIELFERQPAVLERWRGRLRYLLVDEYQDTNKAQYDLVRCLVGGGAGFTVVGDDDQSIYAWRGAEPGNLNRLQADFPDLKVIKLEQNYRSTARILKAANALIANNPHLFEKTLWAEGAPGAPIRVIKASSEEQEAERVVSELQFHKFKHEKEYRDYAILFRSNYQARLLERVLRERRIPYYLSGASSFFDRTEIRDVMAYLRLLCNPLDDTAFLRVVNTPRREIGPATLEALARFAAERQLSLLAAARERAMSEHLAARQYAPLRAFGDWLSVFVDRVERDEAAKLACDLLAELHYEDWLKDTCNDQKIAQRRMENVLELIAWIARMGRDEHGNDRSLIDIVGSLSLMGLLDKNSEENPGDCVALMTLHAAKGLEFSHVFIVGMEEGLLPHHASLARGNGETSPSAPGASDPTPCTRGIEEERRLAYVGLTRAKESLTLALATRRKRGGEIVATKASRFLDELPPEDLIWVEPDAAQDPKAGLERADVYLTSLRQILRNP